MPLSTGTSREAVSHNIRQLIGEGRPHDQAVAIALSVAHRAAAAHAQHRASGGFSQPSPTQAERSYMRDEDSKPFHGGLINSSVPGRTDQHNLDVPAGSYVLPADVVSGLGEGNSMAGAAVVQKMFGTGPFGVPLQQHGHGGMGIPGAPPMPRDEPAPPVHFAHGGNVEYYQGGAAGPPVGRAFAMGGHSDGQEHGWVPIVAAGGEVVIPPSVVKNHPLAGRGNLTRGHNALDYFVKKQREKNIAELKKLPGPAK